MSATCQPKSFAQDTAGKLGVDEYEPEQVEGKPPRKPKREKWLLESVAQLKDPTRIASHNSRSFLSDYRAMIYGVQRKIDSFCEPNEKSIPSLSQSEMEELQSLTDSCCEMMQSFIRQLKEGQGQHHA